MFQQMLVHANAPAHCLCERPAHHSIVNAHQPVQPTHAPGDAAAYAMTRLLSSI